MRLRKHWLLFLFSAAFAILGVRLLWTFTQTTIGWSAYRNQWIESLWRLFNHKEMDLASQSPKAQADFWMLEVSRVNSNSRDPQMTIGGAWIMDAPQFGFILQHPQKEYGVGFPQLPGTWKSGLNAAIIDSMAQDFEVTCRRDCVSWAETATRLDADNPDLWRARALLQFESTFGSLEFKPRYRDWLKVLDECAAHDPENALYDYLAAIQLWSSSAKYESDETGFLIKMNDPTTFDQGTSRFTAGQHKLNLTFVRDGHQATVDFLDASSLSPFDRLDAAESREIDSRANKVLLSIARWQNVLLDAEKREQLFDAAISHARTVLRVADQVSKSGSIQDIEGTRLSMRRWGLANIKDINANHSTVLDVDESTTVVEQLDQARLDLEVQSHAFSRLRKKINLEDKNNEARGPFAVMALTQPIVIATAFLALIAGLIGLAIPKAGNGEGLELSKLTRMRQVIRAVARFSLLIAAVSFLVSLSVAPIVIKTQDGYYNRHIRFLTEPARLTAEVEAFSKEIRSDESLMSKLRNEIAQRN